jgi:hypothetical protein
MAAAAAIPHADRTRAQGTIQFSSNAADIRFAAPGVPNQGVWRWKGRLSPISAGNTSF